MTRAIDYIGALINAHPEGEMWIPIVGKAFALEGFKNYLLRLPPPAWAEFVVLHNTSNPVIAHWHDVPGEKRMKALASYYQGLGWHAGPHLFVADDYIWVFTPPTQPGVHSPSWNHVALGVEMVGDYNSEAFDSGAGAKVRDNTAFALGALYKWIDKDTSTLRLHKEDPLTTHDCPGAHVSKADMIARAHTVKAGLKWG